VAVNDVTFTGSAQRLEASSEHAIAFGESFNGSVPFADDELVADEQT
jgi:hypothetical protein